MNAQNRSGGLLVAMAVGAASLVGGVVVIRAPWSPVAAAAVAAWVAVASLVARRTRSSALFASGYVLLAFGIFTVSWNAIDLGGGVKLSDPLLLGAGAIFALTALTERRPLEAPAWFLAAVAVFLAGGFVSVMFAEHTAANLAVLVRFTLVLAVMPLVVAYAGQERLKPLVDVWVVGVLASAIAALLDAYAHTHIGPSVLGVEFFQRYAGLTAHPNSLALTCAMAAPVVLVTGWRTSVRLVMVGILVAAINVSGSRAGLAAVVAALLVAVLLLRGQRLRIVVAVVAGAFAIVLVGNVGTLTAIDRLTHQATVTQSDSGHHQLEQHAWDEIQKDPLTGEGLSTVRQAHNIYLQLLQAGGVLLFAGFMLYALGALRLAWQQRGDPLHIALGASLIAWFVAGLVQNDLYDRYLYIPVGLLLALWLRSRREPV